MRQSWFFEKNADFRMSSGNSTYGERLTENGLASSMARTPEDPTGPHSAMMFWPSEVKRWILRTFFGIVSDIFPDTADVSDMIDTFLTNHNILCISIALPNSIPVSTVVLKGFGMTNRRTSSKRESPMTFFDPMKRFASHYDSKAYGKNFSSGTLP